jgi:hypothetical protein
VLWYLVYYEQTMLVALPDGTDPGTLAIDTILVAELLVGKTQYTDRYSMVRRRQP